MLNDWDPTAVIICPVSHAASHTPSDSLTELPRGAMAFLMRQEMSAFAKFTGFLTWAVAILGLNLSVWLMVWYGFDHSSPFNVRSGLFSLYSLSHGFSRMVQAAAGASTHHLFRFRLPAMCLLATSTLSATFPFLILFADKRYVAAGLFCLIVVVIALLYTSEFWFVYAAKVAHISRRIGLFIGGILWHNVGEGVDVRQLQTINVV
jgi:hypothetical protein